MLETIISARRLIGPILLLLAQYAFAAAPLTESLSDGRTGSFSFKSVDRKTGPYILSSGKQQMTDAVEANLLLPDGAGPFPAMVIAHSSGGVNKRDYAWADWLRERGIAALVVDSYKHRGIIDTVSDQAQLTYVASTADQLVALRLLATHPKIDAARIGIIGFSRGGSAALGAAFEVWRKQLSGGAKFAVHLSVYGGCGWMADTWTGAPVYQFIGDMDDLNQPVSVCEAHLKKLRAMNVTSELYVFKNARHGYDNLEVPKDYYIARGVKFDKCSYIWDVEALKVYSPAESSEARPNSELGEIIKSCSSRGPTLGPNMKATSDTKAIIDNILLGTLLKR